MSLTYCSGFFCLNPPLKKGGARMNMGAGDFLLTEDFLRIQIPANCQKTGSDAEDNARTKNEQKDLREIIQVITKNIHAKEKVGCFRTEPISYRVKSYQSNSGSGND